MLVTKKSKRPASEEDRCFYCLSHIGKNHKEDCLLIRKKVKVRFIVEYEVSVPASWEADTVVFQRNESSYCLNNALDELEELSEQKGCLCGNARFEFIEETSEPFLQEEK